MAALEFEKKIISIIQNGDIEELEKICLRHSDANRPFSIIQDVKIITPSKKCPFRIIHSPTILVLSILSEQPKILQYILDKLKPDLNYRVNGWTPLHYACCTGSYECLQILLQYEFIQENIDQPVIDLNSTNSDPSYATTALHIAVSNHRHAQAILLTSELPDILYGPTGDKLESPKQSEYQSTNLDQLSSHGSSALHIAAKINDSDMIKILIFAGADTNIMDSHDRTPLDLVKDLGNNAIASLFEQPNTDYDEETMREKYIKPCLPQQIVDSSNHTNINSDEQNDYVPKSEFIMLTEKVEYLVGMIQQLNTRIQLLESNGTKDELHICHRCGCTTERKCEKCGEYYCENCISKPPHFCTQN